jgi:hypothetical protein
MTDLVDRYIDAIKRYLPARSREDVAAEIRSILEEKVEAVARHRGLPPSDDEIARVLREHGHPYEIALAYHPRKALVGERAYPLYRRALGISLAIYLLVAVALELLRLEQHQGPWALSLVPDFLGSVGSALLSGFLIITLVFHFFGEQLAHNPFFWRMDPRRLPAVTESWANIPLTQSFLSIIASVIGLCALSVAQSYVADGVDVRITPAAFAYLHPLRVLIFGLLVLSTLNLFQRYWTRAKLLVFGVIASGIVACMIAIVSTPVLVHFTLTTPDDVARAAANGHWGPFIANLNLRIALGIVAAKVLYDAALSLLRAVRMRGALI